MISKRSARTHTRSSAPGRWSMTMEWICFFSGMNLFRLGKGAQWAHEADVSLFHSFIYYFITWFCFLLPDKMNSDSRFLVIPFLSGLQKSQLGYLLLLLLVFLWPNNVLVLQLPSILYKIWSCNMNF